MYVACLGISLLPVRENLVPGHTYHVAFVSAEHCENGGGRGRNISEVYILNIENESNAPSSFYIFQIPKTVLGEVLQAIVQILQTSFIHLKMREAIFLRNGNCRGWGCYG